MKASVLYEALAAMDEANRALTHGDYSAANQVQLGTRLHNAAWNLRWALADENLSAAVEKDTT